MAIAYMLYISALPLILNLAFAVHSLHCRSGLLEGWRGKRGVGRGLERKMGGKGVGS